MSATNTPLLSAMQRQLYHLLYHLLNFLITLDTLIRTLFHSLRPQPPITPHLPPHIALSGALSAHPTALATLIYRLSSSNVSHISLHDPWTPINTPLLRALIQNRHPSLPLIIHEIHSDGSQTTYPPLTPPPTSSNTPIVTLIHPHAGNAALVAAARRLTYDNRCQMSVDQIIQWLDRQSGMLPSEPDVLLVFPPRPSRPANVLHGFPPWQIRLTQIRFASLDLAQIHHDELLRMVSSAAAAPKRFGR